MREQPGVELVVQDALQHGSDSTVEREANVDHAVRSLDDRLTVRLRFQTGLQHTSTGTSLSNRPLRRKLVSIQRRPSAAKMTLPAFAAEHRAAAPLLLGVAPSARCRCCQSTGQTNGQFYHTIWAVSINEFTSHTADFINTHTRLTAFFRDYPGKPVPER